MRTTTVTSISRVDMGECGTLQVEDSGSMSVSLSYNGSEDNSAMNQIECTSLSGRIDHTVTVCLDDGDISTLYNSSFKFEPLLPSTKYECCFDGVTECCSGNFTTKSLSQNLSLGAAGAIGGVVGIVVILLLAAGIASILYGALVLARRKRAIKRSRHRPVLRTNSKIYKRGEQDQETETSPESLVENTLKPLSLPTTKQRPQPPKKPYQPKPHQQHQTDSKSSGPGSLAPPINSIQGNYYTSQNKAPGPIDSSFEDDYYDDDDEFAEPEETYETMLSTADNVAYKNRPPAPRVQRKTRPKPPQQVPEEYYDYLPG